MWKKLVWLIGIGLAVITLLTTINISSIQAASGPAAPTNLSASVISCSQINLSWSDNINFGASYKIERKTGGGSWIQIATTGFSTKSYSNSGLSPNTTYYYRVRAYYGFLNSAYSNGIKVITFPQIPGTIKILRVATGKIETVDFNSYIKNVLPKEWIGSWNMNALEAGAMAVKTYAWYWTLNQKYPGKGYNLRDDTYDQVYVPGSALQTTNQAVDQTWNWIMTINGVIFQSQYDSGTQNSPNPIYSGRMSQWGTQYWAQKGKDWQWIIKYYYPSSALAQSK